MKSADQFVTPTTTNWDVRPVCMGDPEAKIYPHWSIFGDPKLHVFAVLALPDWLTSQDPPVPLWCPCLRAWKQSPGHLKSMPAPAMLIPPMSSPPYERSTRLVDLSTAHTGLHKRGALLESFTQSGEIGLNFMSIICSIPKALMIQFYKW